MWRGLRSLSLIPHLMPFYAVRCGRHPGIYQTWDDCSSQVKGFAGAQFKKFSTAAAAHDFVDGRPTPSTVSDSLQSSAKRPQSTTDSVVSQQPKRVKTDNLAQPKSTATKVFTDGCCLSNGQYGAKAGVGVYWPDGYCLNVSEKLKGRPTNQRAEIEACARAVEQAKGAGLTDLQIHTDSKYTIKGATEWIHGWKANGWKTSARQDVKNKEDFQRLDAVSEGISVEYVYVPGHTGIPGNEMADQLANEGANK